MKKTLLLCVMMFVVGVMNAQVRQKLSVQFTRPPDATAYTAGDVLTDTNSVPLVFSNNLYSAGKVVLAKITTDTANTANGTFRLWLYSDSTGMGSIADNAAFANSGAYDTYCIGYIDFTLENAGQAGGVALHINMAPGLEYYVGSGKGGLYGRLTAKAAYQPKYAGVIKISLDVERK